MWIRSQDKTRLIKVEEFTLYKANSNLESELLELGYEEIGILKNHYVKRFCIGVLIYITFDTSNKCVGYVKELPLYMFDSQEQINNIQQAYNQLQKDLEVLKEYE